MGKISLLDVLYSRNKTELEFNFDFLTIPSMENFMTMQDIEGLYNIATSIRYAANIDKKYKAINDIMYNRGFRKFAAGTNRVVYSYLEDTRFLAKIAIDKVGMQDNPAEYKNQFLLKPFVTKCFQVGPSGVIGLFERVMPITNITEFQAVSDDIFDLLVLKIIGNYVIDDVGTEYFMNWGIREGFGPCILDYPYVFKLDPSKLICNNEIVMTGKRCGGKVDYDEGFNNLVCKECGRHILARDLQSLKQEQSIIVKGEKLMKVYYIKDGVPVYPEMSSDFIQPIMNKPKEVRKIKTLADLKVGTNRDIPIVPDEPDKVEEKQIAVEENTGVTKEEVVITSTHDEPIVETRDEDKDETIIEVKSNFIPRDESGRFVKATEVDISDKPKPRKHRSTKQKFDPADNYDEYFDEDSPKKKENKRRNSSIDKF